MAKDMIMGGEEELLAGGSAVYRAAFPAYRVFIFGQEVTNDVIAVRPNHSGGSAERQAGSCSITMNNHDDRYTLTHADMVNIKRARTQATEINNSLVMTDFDDSSQWEAMSLEYLHKTQESEYAPIQKSLEEQNGKERDNMAFGSESETRWNEIKIAVVNAKAAKRDFYKPLEQKSNEPTKQYKGGWQFFYPYQEGDCIFHPNDPVRVVFRDPFDSRIWYWMFTGFVDSWTEDVDTNKASTLTITCTDVTKSARYSLVQIFGVLDQDFWKSAQGVIDTPNLSKDTRPIPFQEIFQGMTTIEILETIFFGSESTKASVNAVKAGILDDVKSMSAEDARLYLLSKNVTPEDLKKYTKTVKNEDGEVMLSSASVKELTKLKIDEKQKVYDRMNTLNFSSITSPGGITFKRASENYGVSYYYYQYDDLKATSTDKVLGKSITDLNQWNELIHHRVRWQDLGTMSYTAEAALSAPQSYDVDKIITIIGTNTTDYPVGNGRVYLFAPATFNSELNDMYDMAFNGNMNSMHSAFRDRLSFIYDLAEMIDFRFYATPKGDLVFEMPFYDYDAWYFTGKYGIRDKSDVEQKYLPNYTEAFGKVYSGSYSMEDVQKLTQMTFDLVTNDADLQINKYEQDPVFDWGKTFTIEEHEQYGYSNTVTDEGYVTVYRCAPNVLKVFEEANKSIQFAYSWAAVQELIPMLGFRVDDVKLEGYLVGAEAAALRAALQLNKVNADAHNISISIIANFGLMVNRPIFWRQKNYMANIVSLQHSIAWNSSLDTTVNLSHVRGWSGETCTDSGPSNGKPLYKHFGATDRPYNLLQLLQADKNQKAKYKQDQTKKKQEEEQKSKAK